jgi:hypothetical protein
VVNRLHVYDVPVTAATRAYMDAMMDLPAWQEGQAQAEPWTIGKYCLKKNWSFDPWGRFDCNDKPNWLRLSEKCFWLRLYRDRKILPRRFLAIAPGKHDL